jgi:hypothetical protein
MESLLKVGADLVSARFCAPSMDAILFLLLAHVYYSNFAVNL